MAKTTFTCEFKLEAVSLVQEGFAVPDGRWVPWANLGHPHQVLLIPKASLSDKTHVDVGLGRAHW